MTLTEVRNKKRCEQEIYAHYRRNSISTVLCMSPCSSDYIFNFTNHGRQRKLTFCVKPLGAKRVIFTRLRFGLVFVELSCV